MLVSGSNSLRQNVIVDDYSYHRQLSYPLPTSCNEIVSAALRRQTNKSDINQRSSLN